MFEKLCDKLSPVFVKLGLPPEEAKAVVRGAAVALGGAVLTLMMQAVIGMSFGLATPLVVALVSILVNYLRKYLAVQNQE